MKKSLKKFSLIVCTVAASLSLAASAAFAVTTERPMPEGDESAVVDTTVDQVDTSAGDQVDTSSGSQVVDTTTTNTGTSNAVTNPINNVNTNQNATTNKKYLTRMGGFLWFLLSVLVNLILSYLIGNRFYQLARKSAQGSSEIRALRKDIEEKFAGTLKDISEPATEIMNQNESYARSDEGLAMPERRRHVELNDEEREMMRKWDSRNRAKAAETDEYDDEYDEYEEERQPRRSRRAERAYKPTRRSSGIDFEDDDDISEEDYDEYDEYDEYEERRPSKKRPAKMSRSERSSGRSKKKGFSNILHFNDDDR